MGRCAPQKTGRWPNPKSGDVVGARGEKWRNIANALFRGGRGLPAGSSLAQVLTERRGVRNLGALPDLSIKVILLWADAHHQKTGQWPKVASGDVLGAPGEKWSNLDASLSQGGRGLPGGSSLARLLAERRGVRNPKALPRLTVKQILRWADGQHRNTGQWPNQKSGDVLDAPGEKWANINAGLFHGGRGLSGGSSLARLLAERRGVRG